jgi:hypothetical protein
MNPDEKRERPVEQEAVNTTIVGGRPPGSGRGIGDIPRGIEVLVKKAAVDAEFRAALVETRSKAAGLIGLPLTSAESAMLDIVPRAQLEAIIDRTTVHPNQVSAFLGYAAAVMLVALGATVPAGCTLGCRPDHPPASTAPDNQTVPPVTRGVQPDRPKAKTAAVETLTYEDTSGFVTFSPGGNMADRPKAKVAPDATNQKTESPERLIVDGGVVSVGGVVTLGMQADLPKAKATGERESIKPNPTGVSGGIRVEGPRRKAPVVTPADAVVPADAAKGAGAVDAKLQLKEAQDALERFQIAHVRVAKYVRTLDRIRLWQDNPAAPGATAALEAEEANLKALGDVPPDAVVAYKAQLAALQDALRQAKANALR